VDDRELESAACTPASIGAGEFNPQAQIPYGCTTEHVGHAMSDFVDFLGFINRQLHTRDIVRLESLLMPANFSSMVGEFMAATLPKYCPTLARNRYHNGYPDLIPAGRFPGDAIQYTQEGIEIKASRYLRGWQGHNPEDIWLMVFVFDSNRPQDATRGVPPHPFRFVRVLGAQLTREDWAFAGRSGTSRRTITASVTGTGFEKLTANWIYRAAD